MALTGKPKTNRKAQAVAALRKQRKPGVGLKGKPALDNDADDIIMQRLGGGIPAKPGL